nr:hypothetical protein [Deinococcus aestuarii]
MGRGGQGAVYTLASRTDAVAKIYLQAPDAQTTRKLDALARVGDPQLLSVSAWPQSVLKDSAGRVQGFVMPLVDESTFHELHLLYRPASRRQFFPGVDWRFLVHVARNVARGFAVLHSRGHLMGDVSSRNVMVSPQGVVRFIDTDSFQIKVGSETYPCPVGTAEFTPPELQGKGFGALLRTTEHDLFGLALLIFHLLFDGRHPYAGVHDDKATPSPAQAIAADQFAYSLRQQTGVKPPPFSLTLNGLHRTLQDLFERAFSPRHQNRPSAAEWEAILADLAKQLTACSRNASHWHDRRLPCPWCALLPGNIQAATVKTGIPAGAKRFDVEAELNRIWQGVNAIPLPPPPPAAVVRGVPGPLALPAKPVLTVPLVTPSPRATLWGAVFVLVAVWAAVQSLWLLCFVFACLGWYHFNKNSAGNLKARQQARRVQAEQAQQLEYLGSLRQDLAEHERQADLLRRQISEALARQQAVSAQTQYRAALKGLEELRREVRALNQEEQDELAGVVERHRQPRLERYLSQHVIRPGVVAGVGPALIATLNQHGVYTARDVNPNVRWIKGVGPRRQQDLLAWRDTLEQFFQFDPAQVPVQEYDAVRTRLDQKRRTKLKTLEDAVAQLRRDLVSWQTREQAIALDVGELKFKLAQRERTIALIQQGLPHLN